MKIQLHKCLRIFSPGLPRIVLFLGAMSGFLLLSSCTKKESSDSRPGTSIFAMISRPGAVHVDLETDIDALARNKKEETYQDAVIRFPDTAGTPLQYDIEISARGITRKNYCDVTPMRLKFPKSLRKEAGLASFKTLKLVTPCKDSAYFEDLVLREYLCYRLYQLFTDQSFRVQLARIRLLDSGTGEEMLDANAFFIEHEDEMAERIQGKIIEDDGNTLKSIDMESYNLLTVFQYMIGNTDWNLSMRHNVKLVASSRGSSPIPVPYDFDYSGLVNAPYARPHPDIPVSHVRERLFQWRGKDSRPLEETLQKFRDNKPLIVELVNNMDQLAVASREDMIAYINAFYEVIEGHEPIQALLASRSGAG